MLGRFAIVAGLLALLSLWRAVTKADDAAESVQPTPPQLVVLRKLVVLRNGEVLSGAVSQAGERYVVRIEGGEIHLAAREVDFVCGSLDEAYEQQRHRQKAGRIADHLHLADWSLRHGLPGYAAQQISAAMAIDARDPRVARMESRLRQALEQVDQRQTSPPSENDRPKSPPPLKPDDLDRFARVLPMGTVEYFATTIQPMLSNNCATAGCHGSGSTSSYALIRPPQRKAVPLHLTLRNLHNTLEQVNLNRPEQSDLLVAAGQPHANRSAAILAEGQSKQFEQLQGWVLMAAGKAESGSLASGSPRPSVPSIDAASAGTANSTLGRPSHEPQAAPLAPSGKPSSPAAQSAKSPAGAQPGGWAGSSSAGKYEPFHADDPRRRVKLPAGSADESMAEQGK